MRQLPLWGRHEDAATGRFVDENAIVSAHYAALRRMLNRRCSDQAMVEDVVQDALIVGLNQLRAGTLADVDSVGPYLRQTARYLLIGQYRRGARRAEALCAYRQELEAASGQDEAYESRLSDERRAELARRIDRLTTARDQRLLRGYLLQGETKASLCQALQLSAEHFDRVLSRAKSRLLAGTAARAAGRHAKPADRTAAYPAAGLPHPADSHRSRGPVADKPVAA